MNSFKNPIVASLSFETVTLWIAIDILVNVRKTNKSGS